MSGFRDEHGCKAAKVGRESKKEALQGSGQGEGTGPGWIGTRGGGMQLTAGDGSSLTRPLVPVGLTENLRNQKY